MMLLLFISDSVLMQVDATEMQMIFSYTMPFILYSVCIPFVCCCHLHGMPF